MLNQFLWFDLLLLMDWISFKVPLFIFLKLILFWDCIFFSFYFCYNLLLLFCTIEERPIYFEKKFVYLFELEADPPPFSFFSKSSLLYLDKLFFDLLCDFDCPFTYIFLMLFNIYLDFYFFFNLLFVLEVCFYFYFVLTV
jgi:hypothetical protein